LYLANDANVLKSIETINSRSALANRESFYPGRFDEGTNAGKRLLEYDVRLWLELAYAYGLIAVAAEQKRVVLADEAIDEKWISLQDTNQLACLLVVLFRRPSRPLFIDPLPASSGGRSLNGTNFLIHQFLYYAADAHGGCVRLLIERNGLSFVMCKMLAAMGVDIHFIDNA
jgi:hypothetical protein